MPQSREGQALRWVMPNELSRYPMPPADLRWSGCCAILYGRSLILSPASGTVTTGRGTCAFAPGQQAAKDDRLDRRREAGAGVGRPGSRRPR